jgi:hypothetical protein
MAWLLHMYYMVVSLDLGRKDDRSSVAASWRPGP